MLKKIKSNNASLKNSKHKKLKIILLLLGIIIGIIFIRNFVLKEIAYRNDQKIIHKIQEIQKEKITYVFIEINPELVLTLKNNTVNHVACLNQDCLEISNDLDVVGENLEESIEKIYNVAQEKGFNTDNGVKIKYRNGENLPIKLDYVTTEIIDQDTEKDLLNHVITDTDVFPSQSDSVIDYNNKLWSELKKDKDYGKYYECSIMNEELECHIKDDILLGFVITSGDFQSYLTKFAGVFDNLSAIERIFHKFKIETKGQIELGFFNDPIRNIYINNREYEILSSENQISQNTFFDTFKGCDYAQFKLTDLNLLNPSSIESKLFYSEGATQEQYSIDTVECGKKYCKKSVTTFINRCDEATKHVELNVDSYDNYYLCDIHDSNNCQEVNKEVYDKTGMNFGFIEDLEECIKNEEGYYIIGEDGYEISPSGEYCKYRIDSNEWRVNKN